MRHERRALRAAARLILGLALACALAAPALAQSWGEVRMVETPVNVRKERSPQSPVVRTLKPGERVKVDYLRPSGWGAVFEVDAAERDDAKAIGFADVRLMKPVDAAVQPKVSPKAVLATTSAPTPAPTPSAPSPPASSVTTASTPVASRTIAAAQSPAPAAAPPVHPAAPTVQPVAPAAPPRAVEARQTVAPKPEGMSTPAPQMKGEVKDNPALLGNQPSLNTQAPVRITSDKMIYNQAENSVVFVGNVHGTHTDMAIWAGRITAYFTDKKKAKDAPAPQEKGPDKGPGDFGDKIERIVAEGNVRLVANKNEGACAQLTYLVTEGVIRMDGNPILREGQNTIRGESIKFYIRENRSEVLSGGQRRVEAIFMTPKGDKK